MHNDDFIDRNAAFEQQVQREGDDLRLAAKRRHKRMLIPLLYPCITVFSFSCLSVKHIIDQEKVDG